MLATPLGSCRPLLGEILDPSLRSVKSTVEPIYLHTLGPQQKVAVQGGNRYSGIVEPVYTKRE